MPGKVIFIPKSMFPIAVLPDRLFTFPASDHIDPITQTSITMFGKPSFDQSPSGSIIRIPHWQGPDGVKMVGQYHYRFDSEWPFGAHASRNTLPASAEARIGLRRSVSRVKKKTPPGVNARRYLIGTPLPDYSAGDRPIP
ncbi:MAG: hypothetical protein ABW076_11080 [Candidatus Thiodiazotropha sp.]